MTLVPSTEQLAASLGRSVSTCRMCGGSRLHRYLDLGHMPPADQFLRPEQLARPIVAYPLDVLLCESCGLSQLGYVVSPHILYQEEYPYESSLTRAGPRHFRAFAATVVERFATPRDSLAVDIGSNVGVLLSGFQEEGLRVLGVDPAANIAAIAEERGVPTLAALFSPEIASRIVAEHGTASVITATNVFAHVDDLDDLLRAVDTLLAPDGVFVIEAPYLVNLLDRLEYDTIYHEHLSYLSVRPLSSFFERHGMRLFDVEESDIHGGSCRFFIDRGSRPVAEATLRAFVAREKACGAYDPAALAGFAARVEANRLALKTLLNRLRDDGRSVVAVSAPAKGMTLLNYCRLGPETLGFVTEKSRLKIGRVTPGMHIPVVGDDELLAQQPDYALLLAWNFAQEIIENLRAYRERGGRFIIPIPEPHVIVPEGVGTE